MQQKIALSAICLFSLLLCGITQDRQFTELAVLYVAKSKRSLYLNIYRLTQAAMLMYLVNVHQLEQTVFTFGLFVYNLNIP